MNYNETQLAKRFVTHKTRMLVLKKLLETYLEQSTQQGMTHKHRDSRVNHILQIMESWDREDKKLPRVMVDDDVIPF